MGWKDDCNAGSGLILTIRNNILNKQINYKLYFTKLLYIRFFFYFDVYVLEINLNE